MDSSRHEILSKILGLCTGHGACFSDCQLLREQHGLSPRDIAAQVLNGRIGEDVSRYIISCDLCGLCVRSCPDGLNIPGMVVEARRVLLTSGASDPGVYRAFWIDHDWNAITLYRDTYRIDYSDLIKPGCDTLFFPGCFLANSAPELVRAAVGWLKGHFGQEVSLTTLCCGLPLVQIGLAERAERYMKWLWRRVGETGARRIVTACPSCHYHLSGNGNVPDIEVVSLYKLMAEAGVRAPGSGIGGITVHDSCPDRNGEIGNLVRKILGYNEIVEMAHHGASAICCGSGGLVAVVAPELSRHRTEKRMKEFVESGAAVCVTSCMTCCNTLSLVAEKDKVRHILESVFDRPVDHEQYNARVEAMWQGKAGDYNTCRLENSRLMESLADNVGT